MRTGFDCEVLHPAGMGADRCSPVPSLRPLAQGREGTPGLVAMKSYPPCECLCLVLCHWGGGGGARSHVDVCSAGTVFWQRSC